MEAHMKAEKIFDTGKVKIKAHPANAGISVFS